MGSNAAAEFFQAAELKNMEIVAIPFPLIISGFYLIHQTVRKRESPFLELYGAMRAERRRKNAEPEGEK